MILIFTVLTLTTTSKDLLKPGDHSRSTLVDERRGPISFTSRRRSKNISAHDRMWDFFQKHPMK